MNGVESTFYNELDKHILHAVLAEISKYARRNFKDVPGESRVPYASTPPLVAYGKAKLAIKYCD